MYGKGRARIRKVLIVLLIIALFSGCTLRQGPYYETVCDILPVCDPEDAPYEIQFEAPPGAVRTAQTDVLCTYAAPNGEYAVTARVLVTDGLDAAVYALCGFTQSRIDLGTTKGEECRVAWRGADGAVNRALIRREGDYCYVLCMRLGEGLSGRYNAMINGLFSSFRLTERVR